MKIVFLLSLCVTFVVHSDAMLESGPIKMFESMGFQAVLCRIPGLDSIINIIFKLFKREPYCRSLAEEAVEDTGKLIEGGIKEVESFNPFHKTKSSGNTHETKQSGPGSGIMGAVEGAVGGLSKTFEDGAKTITGMLTGGNEESNTEDETKQSEPATGIMGAVKGAVGGLTNTIENGANTFAGMLTGGTGGKEESDTEDAPATTDEKSGDLVGTVENGLEKMFG